MNERFAIGSVLLLVYHCLLKDGYDYIKEDIKWVLDIRQVNCQKKYLEN